MKKYDLSVLNKHWGWMVIAGGIYVLLGALAIMMPIASTVSLTLALSVILLVGGGVLLFDAFKLRHEDGAGGRFVQSALAIVSGAILLRYPEAGMLGIALMLGFYFFVSSVSRWALATSFAPRNKFNWGYVSAICSFFLGVYVIMTLPFSALWVPGTLLGVDLIAAGVWSIFLGLEVRRLQNLGPLKQSTMSSSYRKDSSASPPQDLNF